MNSEDQAWRDLQRHAAAQLRADFSQRVLRAAHGPSAEAWQQLHEDAARRLRPGFAERVLRAARALPRVKMPSLFDQFAIGAATAAICLASVVYAHERTMDREEQQNIARWHQLAMELEEQDAVR